MPIHLKLPGFVTYLSAKKNWLVAWSWDNDGCATRQVSTAGNFNSLTAYGNDIINNTQYGIFNTAIRSLYLTQAGCVVTNLNTNFNNDTFSFSLFPNPANNQLIISSVTQQLLKIISISGNVLTTVMLNAGSTIIPTHNLASGFYIVVCNNHIKKLVINHN